MSPIRAVAICHTHQQITKYVHIGGECVYARIKTAVRALQLPSELDGERREASCAAICMRSACRMWFLFHNQQPLLPAEFHSLPISFGNFHRVCIHLNGKQKGKFAMHKKSVSGKMALGSVLFFNEGNVTRLFLLPLWWKKPFYFPFWLWCWYDFI